MKHRHRRRLPVLLAAVALLPQGLHAQTIRGRLLDGANGRPIDLGILVLLTNEGDSVGLTASSPDGAFSITAPAPGVYQLQASAFGYARRVEPGFDLPAGSAIEIEYRLVPLALTLDEILVSVDRPRQDHPLIQNGFVHRFQAGLGRFITPRDLERTIYRDTDALFGFMPGVRVIPSNALGAGDRVVMRGTFGGWCTPTVYVDGIRALYDPGDGVTLSFVAPIGTLEGVEVFRSASQAPSQYPPSGYRGAENCGVILFWTKR